MQNAQNYIREGRVDVPTSRTIKMPVRTKLARSRPAARQAVIFKTWPKTVALLAQWCEWTPTQSHLGGMRMHCIFSRHGGSLRASPPHTS